MESPVQRRVARRVRWGGCGDTRPTRTKVRRALTQSVVARLLSRIRDLQAYLMVLYAAFR